MTHMPLLNEERQELATQGVFVGDRLWAACANKQEANEAVTGMRLFNRWWRNNNGKEIVRIGLVCGMARTQPMRRCWCCTWVPGHAGWDCQPLVMPQAEHVRLNNSRGEQIVYVYAPTALLAIERAKFMLMEGGKKNDY